MRKTPETIEPEYTDNLTEQEREALESLGIKIHPTRKWEIPEINEELLSGHIRRYNIMDLFIRYLNTCYLEDSFDNHSIRRRWMDSLVISNKAVHDLINRTNGIRKNKADMIYGMMSAVIENYVGKEIELLFQHCNRVQALCLELDHVTETKARIAHVEQTKSALIDLLNFLAK